MLVICRFPCLLSTSTGYADLGYRAITANGGTNSFRLGQADLFITSKLSDKLSFLMETTIDSDQNNSPGIEIERLLLNYRENEYLNVSMGRYHSAIGYFNAAFHHGRWFQTAVDRPFLFEFEDEGGILPIHNVGVSVSGRVPSGDLRLNYVVGSWKWQKLHAKFRDCANAVQCQQR